MNDIKGTIDNWSFCYREDDYDTRYKAPELRKKSIQGILKEDNLPITTSYVVHIDHQEKIITTRSGSNYKLGYIDEEYKEYCIKNNIDFKLLEGLI